jgi:hypothetical protein
MAFHPQEMVLETFGCSPRLWLPGSSSRTLDYQVPHAQGEKAARRLTFFGAQLPLQLKL